MMPGERAVLERLARELEILNRRAELEQAIREHNVLMRKDERGVMTHRSERRLDALRAGLDAVIARRSSGIGGEQWICGMCRVSNPAIVDKCWSCEARQP